MRDTVDSGQAARRSLQALEAGVAVTLIGQPYSGRSTTLQRVADLAGESGLTMRVIRAVAPLQSQPFGALAAAGVGAGSGASLTIQTAIAELSGPNRLIAVDDVGAIDSHSFGAVIEAARRSGRPLIMTVDSMEDLDRFDHHQPSMVLTMSGITYVDTLAIVNEELGGRATPGTVRRIHGKSGGLPGLAVRLVKIARLEGTIQLTNGVWTAAPRLWTQSMRGLISPFFDGLSASDIEALRILSAADLSHALPAREAVGDETYSRLLHVGRIREFTIAHSTMFTVFPPLLTEYFRSFVHEPDEGFEFTERADVSALSSFAQVDWRREVDQVVRAPGGPVTPAVAIRTLKTAIAAGAELDLDDLAGHIAPGPESEVAAAAIWRAFAWGVRGDESNLDRVFAEARAAHPSLEGFISSAHAHLRFALRAELDTAPDGFVSASGDLNDGGWAIVRAENALARGRMHEAREALETLSGSSAYFTRYADALQCLALLLDGRIDEASARSLSAIEDALAEHDLELIGMYGYTAAVSLYTAGRDQELAVVLDLLLSVIVRTPSMHGGYTMGILGCAASAASDERLQAAAEELASQMTTIGAGPAAWPFASRDFALGVVRNTAPDFAPACAEAEAHFDAGRISAALVHESIIGWLQPALVDVERVENAISATESPLLKQLGEFALAGAAADETRLEQVSDDLSGLGAYRAALGARVAAALRSPEEDRPVRLFRTVTWALDRRLDLDLIRRVVPMSWIFTGREIEIVALASTSLNNREIAERLAISARTVESHLSAIYRKMGITSRGELPPPTLFT